MELRTIARIKSDFPDKFGIPRQSGMVEELRATVIFEREFRSGDALRGLEDFSHLWLIWGFSEAKRDSWSPTVRPPRLGGNARMGVFATRSPYRPNAIGLSSARLDRIEAHPDLGPVIHVLGADLMDGTPIYDIKPYLPYTDSHPGAVGGYAGDPPGKKLTVVIEEKWLALVPESSRNVLKELLAFDPRPRYQDDPRRVYGMTYGGLDVRFTVAERRLTVTEIVPLK